MDEQHQQVTHQDIVKSMTDSPSKWATMFINMKKEYNKVVGDYVDLKDEYETLIESLIEDEKLERITIH